MQNISFELDIIKSKSLMTAGDRVVVGYASTFDVDTDDTQITREALEGSKDDLLKYSTVLFNHDTDRPIGHVIETDVDDIGLLVKVIISKTEDDVWNKIQDGTLNKFSIKGRALEYAPIFMGEGREILQITKTEFFETSIVSVPANKEAETICSYIAKSLNLDIVKKENEQKEILKSSKIENMNTLIEKLKLIQEKGNEEIKTDVDIIIKQLEKEKSIIANLQILAGKLDANDRVCVVEAVDLLLQNNTITEEEEEIKENDFHLDDESENRPVFQLNINDEDEIVSLADNTNRFKKQILKKGKWFHWDAEGGVLNITDEVIDNLIKNFKKGVIENVSVPLSHTTDPSKNTGEVVGLEKTEDGLDAIIEIKDDSILEKIKKGLIKCISASFDPNYLIKKTKKFIGPTLLHAALVSEPYIKGMGSFIPLSEDFSNRKIVQLEDERPNYKSLYKSLNNKVELMEKQIEKLDEQNETTFKMKEKSEIEKQEELKTKIGTVEVVDNTRGKYIEEEGKVIFKAFTQEENIDFAKGAYQDCVGTEMKAGSDMKEAAAKCKAKVKKELDFDVPEDESEIKSELESGDALKEDATVKVDLADANKAYDEYLREGKLVPAQKDVFIKLYSSSSVLELNDNNKVGIAELMKQFLDSQPKVLNFEEKGTEGGDPVKTEEEIKKEEEIPADAREFFGKLNMSEDKMKEAWKHAQQLKKDEDDAKKSTLF